MRNLPEYWEDLLSLNCQGKPTITTGMENHCHQIKNTEKIEEWDDLLSLNFKCTPIDRTGMKNQWFQIGIKNTEEGAGVVMKHSLT